ncbi:MAG: glycosyltransferase [Planctomycetes bacterium]|nr:glycosyltransferase [Planctomycetota bacterium]
MTLSIIVPCYNEEESIPLLLLALDHFEPKLKAISGLGLEVVFVDDGSEDGTRRELEAVLAPRKNYRLIVHEVNRGVGEAMRNGFSAANGEWVVCYDSDCTYPIDDVLRMLEKQREVDADAVTASPYHPMGRVEDVPAYRLVLSKGLSLLYRLWIGRAARHIRTFSCAFRLYRRDAIQAVRFASGRFLAPTEIMVELLEGGYSVAEIPATLSHRRFGHSKMKVMRTIMSHLRFLTSRLVTGRSRPKNGRSRRMSEPSSRWRAPAGVSIPLDLVSWNEELNKQHSMDVLSENRNPIIRMMERFRRRHLSRIIPPVPDAVVVDIGCESGYVAERVLESCRHLHCIDIDQARLERSRRRLGSDKVDYVQSDIQNVNLASSVADITIASAVLEHVPSPERALRECARITKVGGFVVLCIPNNHIVLGIKRVLRRLRLNEILGGLAAGPAPGPLHIFRRRDVLRLMRSERSLSIEYFTLDLATLCFFGVLKKKAA